MELDLAAAADSMILSKVDHEDRSLKNTIKRCFVEQNLKIVGGQFDYYRFPKILKKKDGLVSQTLNLQRNYLPKIIESLAHLSLPMLNVLDLGMNNIQDIIPLVTLKAPKLRILILRDNRLANTKALRKMPFKLEKLDISGNHIREVSRIGEFMFAETLSALILEEYTGAPKLDQNISKLVKLQPQTIKQIQYSPRINNKLKISDIFGGRFDQSTIKKPRN